MSSTEMEERIKNLENELTTVNTELKQMILDIRSFLMDSTTPLQSSLRGYDRANQNKSGKTGRI